MSCLVGLSIECAMVALVVGRREIGRSLIYRLAQSRSEPIIDGWAIDALTCLECMPPYPVYWTEWELSIDSMSNSQ